MKELTSLLLETQERVNASLQTQIESRERINAVYAEIIEKLKTQNNQANQ